MGVPYQSTMVREKPRSGDRPLPATAIVNGVPHHLSKTPTYRIDQPPPIKTKNRLNLLNPVNLLMRRRSSQAVDTLTDKPSPKGKMLPPMDLPDDYDPRIKGNMVHDFSAPRPRRNLSYNDACCSPTFNPESSTLHVIQQSPETQFSSDLDEQAHRTRMSGQHTPVFTENFDFVDHSNNTSAAVHAESLADGSFLARNSWHNGEPIAPPPFGRKSQQMDEQQVQDIIYSTNRTSDPSSMSSATSATSFPDRPQGLGFTMSDQSSTSPDTIATIESRPVSKELVLNDQPVDLASLPHSTSPEPTLSSSAASSPDPQCDDQHSDRPSGLRHLPSSSSRFSFQIASMDSMAEEKLLEDRHKQRHSTVPDQPTQLYDDDINDDDDDDEDNSFDEDAMYDPDEMEGFDEPEVLGGNNVFQHTHNSSSTSSALATHFDGMNISDPSTRSSYITVPPTSPQANLINSFTTPIRPENRSARTTQLTEQAMERLPAFQLASEDLPSKPKSPSSPGSFYFDDGMIDETDQVDDGPCDRDGNIFDEEQFDDPTFLKNPDAQRYDASTSAAPSLAPPDKSSYYVNGCEFQMSSTGPQGRIENLTSHSSNSEYLPDRERDATERSRPYKDDSHHRNDQEPNPRDSLSAYHNALAEAAQQAAVEGRFTRQTSTDSTRSTYSRSAYSVNEEAQKSVSFEQQPSEEYNHVEYEQKPSEALDSTFANHSAHPSYSGFNFGMPYGYPDMNSMPPDPEAYNSDYGYQVPPDDDDYDFDDSDLIAAANAEALSADDSGMYSQEFGFYARPRPGSAEGERDINGGYFGQAGIEIQRQKSLREPNLTPITERSEFSHRNSFNIGPGSFGAPWSPMSHAGSAQGLPSPALSTTMSLAQQRGMSSPMNRTATIPENENLTLAEIRRSLHANAHAGSISSVGSDYGAIMSSPLAEYAPAYPAVAGSVYMPAPRGGPRTIAGIGGVPMSWQRSEDSNHSHPSSHSHSSSLAHGSPVVMVPPMPMPAPHITQAQAFSFFESGDDGAVPGADTHVGADGNDGSNVTPRKQMSFLADDGTPSSSPQSTAFLQPPTTARKVPPPPISTPSYASMATPSLGSPLRLKSSPMYFQSPTQVETKDRMAATPLESPKRAVADATGMGHKRGHSAGADSVTYVQEKDAETGTKRWILERRRTSAQGLLELVGREEVVGGRI